MAKRGIPFSPGYKTGSHWAICDSCGFQFRAEDLQKTWDNRWVCDEDFEPRHEQDFLRVKKEKIAADQPLRNEDLSNEIAVTFTPADDNDAAAQVIPTGTFNNEI